MFCGVLGCSLKKRIHRVVERPCAVDIERKGNVTIVGSQRQNANRVAAFFKKWAAISTPVS